MKYLFLVFLNFITLITFAQDSLFSKKGNTYDEYLKLQSVKYNNKKFPSFRIKTSDTTEFSNVDIVNKVVFINFWFEACTPCIAEFEGLNEIYRRLKDNHDFYFISICTDADSTIKRVASKYNIEYKVYHIDRKECYRLNFNNGFPASFILDKNGLIKYFRVGGNKDKEQATIEMLEKIYPVIVKELSIL